ncbi:hypothetical protein CFC21_071759 [Triticum aestivum]|uniref:Uncharacterized protein n=2 Tax=Triticum aestivum TaxID=4565 RepID=A0A9R1KTE3_WHEAT|nr:hypothetical protein CFC21_071755 [Triticum aestivum]KAF7065679.1 hypothetical protein CFC21_071759 [Triticum aestivum]
MSMGRLAQVSITLIIVLLYTGLLAEGAMGTNNNEQVHLQSLKLMGLTQESDLKLCRTCHCSCKGDKCDATKCCYLAKCTTQRPLTCVLDSIQCGSCDNCK